MSHEIPPKCRDTIFRITRISEILFSFLSGSITIVSYGTAFWYVDTSGTHVGLWQSCQGEPSVCNTIGHEYDQSYGEFIGIYKM